MRTLWIVGAVLAVTGVIGARRSIPAEFGAWGQLPPPAASTGAPADPRRESTRERQLGARGRALAALQVERSRSERRAAAIETHLASAQSPVLFGARRALDEEQAVAKEIDGKIRRLVVDGETAERDAGVMALLTVVTLLVTGFIGAKISGSKALAPGAASGARGAAEGVAIGAVLFAANTWQELHTSVHVAEKDSFGFASWAVSPWSWGWVRVMALGLCLAFAYVLACAWDAAAPARTPGLDRGHEDGGFGIVSYVTAWRRWVLVGAAASLAIAAGEVIAIAYGREAFNPWYLLTPAVCLAATAVPVARASHRIQELRDACRRARWLASTHTPGVPVPEDPTEAFWELPFKVPAYVILVGSAAWVALEKTGVAGAVLRSLGAGGP